jgi:hypothetical protein
VFIASGTQVPPSVLLTGASTTKRVKGKLVYDGFLAVLNRQGGTDGTAPVVFQLGVDGAAKTSFAMPRPSVRAYVNALAKKPPASACAAFAADAKRPTQVGFLDRNTADQPLATAGRLELARGAAALCTSGDVQRVNTTLAPLGGGVIGKQAPGFTPQTLAGTWTGTWVNQRFGATGPASFVVTNPDPQTLTFTASFGGNVFGCGQPPPGSGAMTFGTGPGHWNAGGFTFTKTSPNFGTLTITYDFNANRLTGNGQNPSCNPGLSWAIDGNFTGNTFKGTVDITLPDGSHATSVLTVTRG